ncbi:MAG TPA: hypothetical protein VKV26_00990 [Dehalococcoidia bacterium]|nr:hypothetical protein [Dehalococcoidia bacterium]
MRRPWILFTGLSLLLSGLAACACPRVYAEPAPDAAYYIVVQPGGTGGGQIELLQVNDGNTLISLQSGVTARVECTRYANAADAAAAAALRYRDATWTVELAPDALHALLAAAGIADDVTSLLPPVADADLCTP